MDRIDLVECVGVSQQRNGNVLNVKSPAMRVRDDCYTKNHLSVIIGLFRPLNGVEILEGHLMPGSCAYARKYTSEDRGLILYGYLKGKSALMMFARHANLKYKFGNRHFWSEGYYVSTVELNEAAIRKYIEDQEKADIMQDKLSVKEYEDFLRVRVE